MTPCPIDSLLILFRQLAYQPEVPCVLDHAWQWFLLGEEFLDAGQRAQAEICFSKARQYKALSRLMPDMKRTRCSGYVLLERLNKPAQVTKEE